MLTPRQESLEAARTIRRRAAVDAATAIFARQGFHSTGMSDVARAAGISLKALYEAFPSKEALFSAILEDVGRRFSVVFPRADADPAAELLHVVDQLVQVVDDKPDALRLAGRGTDGLPATMAERGFDPYARYRQRLDTELAAVIVRAHGGQPPFDPLVAARALVAMVMAEARARLDAGTPVIDAAPDLRALIAGMLAIPALPSAAT